MKKKEKASKETHGFIVFFKNRVSVKQRNKLIEKVLANKNVNGVTGAMMLK